jgi:RNA polymerase sigma factor (TIGR02999 family)
VPNESFGPTDGGARPQNASPDVTSVLNAAERGDPQAAARLLEVLYDELRQLAKSRMAHEAQGGAGMTLQATALVHEAYLRVVSGGGGGDGEGGASAKPPQTWQNRGHFFGAAALAMRRILVERARFQKRLRHGGGKGRVDLDDASLADGTDDASGTQTDLLALEEALVKLEQLDPRKAKVVTLRYFAGLTVEETAAAMDLSASSVKNEWAFARAWLHRQLDGDSEG